MVTGICKLARIALHIGEMAVVDSNIEDMEILPWNGRKRNSTGKPLSSKWTREDITTMAKVLVLALALVSPATLMKKNLMVMNHHILQQ